MIEIIQRRHLENLSKKSAGFPPTESLILKFNQSLVKKVILAKAKNYLLLFNQEKIQIFQETLFFIGQ